MDLDYIQRMLARKPLHPAERKEPPSTVCVTGAGGYCASSIVARLLAMGHTVHATWRREDDAATIAAVKALPGAEQRVKWFEADLMKPGSYDDAVKGCKYVIHTASPVNLIYDPERGHERVIIPALRGVENVLRAVNKARTVQRVVMSSSVSAVMGDFHERNKQVPYTEADFTTNVDPSFAFKGPYGVSKTVSEWEAWAICAQQEHWSLVVIAPGNAFGPPVAASPVARGLINSLVNSGLTAPTLFPTCDLDDLAAAHTLAMVTKEAEGRYLLSERSCLHSELVDYCRNEFPGRRVPKVLPFWWCRAAEWFSKTRPFRWLLWLPLHPLREFVATMTNLKGLWGKTAETDSSKITRELGLKLIPLERSMRDMVQRMEELRALPRPKAVKVQDEAKQALRKHQ